MSDKATVDLSPAERIRIDAVLQCVPDPPRGEIRDLLVTQVERGRAAYEATGSVAGRTGQRMIAGRLKKVGITKGTPRYEEVIGLGRDLYYERT